MKNLDHYDVAGLLTAVHSQCSASFSPAECAVLLQIFDAYGAVSAPWTSGDERARLSDLRARLHAAACLHDIVK